MKNNDFDFIKNRFNSVEPSIPNSLNGEILRQKISSNEEYKTIKFEQKKNYFKPIVSAAACFILIAGIAFAANSDIFSTNKALNFINYEELNSKTATLNQVSSSEGLGCETSKVFRYIEEDGVELPNTVKAYDSYIYYAYSDNNNTKNRNKIYIYKSGKGNTNLISIIDNFISDEAEIESVFVDGTKLAIVASTETNTIAKLYNIDDKANPVLISKFEQSGNYSESRLIDSKLYVVSNYAFLPEATNTIPNIKENNEITYASSKNIAYFENVKTAQYAVISTIDINAGKLSDDIKAILGGSANIHCTNDYMYINEYIEGESLGAHERSVTTAIRLNLKNGKFTYASGEEIKKYSNNIIDIGENSYSGILYDIGENLLSIGTDLVNDQDEIILYDKSLNELDRVVFENEHILTNPDWLTSDKEKNIYALSAYFADNSRRYYGVITFKIDNNQIVITNEFKNNDDDLMYQGKCVIIDDCVYSFDINENASDNEKLKIFSYQY